jgi:23S rRNA (guanosine2251-2'-O)-methyltransferase
LTRKKSASDSTTVIYGVHPVLETLAAGKRRIDEIYVARGSALPPWAEERIAADQIRVSAVSPNDLVSVVETPHHQGLGARVGPFPYADLDEIIAAGQGVPGPILILDEVQDPANLGNILRSSECLGAAAVVISKDRSVSVTAVVEKSAAGASAHMPIVRVVNLVRVMEALKAAGYWIYGTAADAPESLYSLDLAGRAAFVLGSEGKGMRRLVREHCDAIVSVPMAGKTASLNVSQVATIILAETLRQKVAALPRGS